MIRIFIFSVLACVIFSPFAFSQNVDTSLIKKAKDITAVKYIFCSTGALIPQKCEVTARFKDLEACERHDEFQRALCDRVSQAGKIICTKQDKSSLEIWAAYCVPD